MVRTARATTVDALGYKFDCLLTSTKTTTDTIFQNAVVEALFSHATAQLHSSMVAEWENGNLPPNVTICHFCPVFGNSAFFIEVGFDKSRNSRRMHRILVDMNNTARGNREMDGVNARECRPPTVCRMMHISYSPTIFDPQRQISAILCNTEDAVVLLRQLVM